MRAARARRAGGGAHGHDEHVACEHVPSPTDGRCQVEGHTDITSGVSAEAEYRRTLGALFAVYWVARIGIDGAAGFSFGVNDAWAPRPVPPETAVGEVKKRRDFYIAQDWPRLQQLFVDAGCLVRDPGAEGDIAVHVERMTALLVLTAIHDVMKVDA